MSATVVRVLFVCTGNICRSPTAEAVFAALVERAGLAGQVEVDSAGTIDYHEGGPSDPQSQRAAEHRGYSMRGLRARKIRARDYDRFDLLLAMGRDHRSYMLAECPPARAGRVRMFLEFAPAVDEVEVPDPYYGGPEDFEHVLDLVEAAAAGLLDHVRGELQR